MKAHFGVDAASVLVDTVVGTAGNVSKAKYAVPRSVIADYVTIQVWRLIVLHAGRNASRRPNVRHLYPDGG